MAVYFSYKLDKSHIIPLLQQYKKYPCLWDPNDRDYKNHENRISLHKKISRELGLNMTEGQLRTRIKNLRSTYVREVRRVIRSKKNGEVYRPRLAWFRVADSFLRNVISFRDIDTESNDSVLDDIEVSVAQSKYIGEQHFLNTDVELEEIIIKQEDDLQEGFNEEYLKGSSNLDVNSSDLDDCVQSSKNKIKLRDISEYMHHKSSSSSENVQSMPKEGSSCEHEDEFDTFGRHVANQLRSLPIREAIRSQNFIHIFLTEERLKFLENKS